MSEAPPPSTATATGRCLCGGVRYHTTGPLRPVWECHCERCRRTSGHHVAATSVARDQLVLDADATLHWYHPADDPAVGYGFCATCGGSVFWRSANLDTISLCAGAIDPPTGLRTEGAMFTAEASDYVVLDPSRTLLPRDWGSGEGERPCG